MPHVLLRPITRVCPCEKQLVPTNPCLKSGASGPVTSASALCLKAQLDFAVHWHSSWDQYTHRPFIRTQPQSLWRVRGWICVRCPQRPPKIMGEGATKHKREHIVKCGAGPKLRRSQCIPKTPHFLIRRVAGDPSSRFPHSPNACDNTCLQGGTGSCLSDCLTVPG